MSKLSVTTIQSKLFWEDRKANLQMFEEKISKLRGATELVVLPEMFSTGFSMDAESLAEDMNGETIQWMKRVAGENRIIMTGSIIIGERLEDEMHYFNRLVWMLPTGEYGIYNKRHAFAYAGEDKIYTPGMNRFIASVKGWKINLQVCYDLRFPVWARQSHHPDQLNQPGSETATRTVPEYDLLIYVANWPERRNHAWKTLLQARAIENQSYVIGVNRVGEDGNGIYHSGDSMIVDPLGQVIHTMAHEEEVFTIELDKEKLQEIRNKFPFWKDADPFLLL